jgi:hypothetical protein
LVDHFQLARISETPARWIETDAQPEPDDRRVPREVHDRGPSRLAPLDASNRRGRRGNRPPNIKLTKP